MITTNILKFNFFFKSRLLKNTYTIKKKRKIKEFNLYFKICNNNGVITVVHKNNVLFWQTCKMFKGSANFKDYSSTSLTNLTRACIFFFQKLKINNRYSLNFFFSGLNKYRNLIIKLFFKNNFFIKNVLDIKFLSHNGVRAQKKRRLAKRRARKIYQYTELKKLKKKKEKFIIQIKANNFFFLKESIFKFNFFFLVHFFKTVTIKTFFFLSLLRSVHNYGKHRQNFVYSLYNLFITFYIQRSWKLRLFFIWYLKVKEINKFDSFFKFITVRKSYKF